jgi:asparaginyl-tRNA synthetase
MKEGDSISTELEKALSAKMGEPFFITGWPKSLLDERGFLYKGEDGSDVLLDFDLIMPEGFGEVSSGSERESDYEKIVESLKRVGRLEGYGDFLELAKDGIVATSGFGIGFERLTMYVCGLEDIAEASAFPKVPGAIN